VRAGSRCTPSSRIERRGHGRYSLWTGDLGVALYAADCLAARSDYPVLETWD
jgi:hypothetical protein